jgi:hypothetical protein
MTNSLESGGSASFLIPMRCHVARNVGKHGPLHSQNEKETSKIDRQVVRLGKQINLIGRAA